MQVASRVVEQLKTEDLQKLGNFNEISEMLGIDGKVFSRPPKWQIMTFVLQNC